MATWHRSGWHMASWFTAAAEAAAAASSFVQDTAAKVQETIEHEKHVCRRR